MYFKALSLIYPGANENAMKRDTIEATGKGTEKPGFNGIKNTLRFAMTRKVILCTGNFFSSNYEYES